MKVRSISASSSTLKRASPFGQADMGSQLNRCIDWHEVGLTALEKNFYLDSSRVLRTYMHTIYMQSLTGPEKANRERESNHEITKQSPLCHL